MRKTHSPVATVLLISLLLVVNLVAFNWTSEFFRSRFGVVLLQHGERMPELEGRGYSGYQTLSVSATKPTLVLYLTAAGIKGQSIALLKFGESLSKQNPNLFQTTLITSGLLPEIQQLLQDHLVSYPIINDAGGQLAQRLGLEPGESGTFFFDKNGLCRFATRQQANPSDLRQLLAAFGVGPLAGTDSADQFPLSKGKPLPSFSLLDVRSLQPGTTEQLSRTDDQVWIFFLADCFACGAPNPSPYLKQFKYWRQATKDLVTEPSIVFDSAFLRHDVTAELEQFSINSPAYISNEGLGALSRFLRAKGRRTDQALIVRTDRSRTVTDISLIEPPGASSSRRLDDETVTGPRTGGVCSWIGTEAPSLASCWFL
jgi:hypothetical protein